MKGESKVRLNIPKFAGPLQGCMFKNILLILIAILLLVFAFSKPAFPETALVKPYLQNVTQTSIVICWITDAESIGTVKYGPGTAANLSASERTGQTFHKVLLQNLEPGRSYRYEVLAGSEKFSGTFQTAPEFGQPFTFTVWGDSQNYDPSPTIFRSIIKQMLKHPVDLVMSIGDVVDNARDIKMYFKDLFKPGDDLFRNVPFYVAAGNHELNGDPDLEKFDSLFDFPGDERYCAFTYSNSRFIIMDSNNITGNQKQVDWLRKEFASDKYKKAVFRFLFLHFAPYSWDWDGGEPSIRDKIVPLAEENKIDIFFAGHYHSYERGVKKRGNHDTYYIVTGGCNDAFTNEKRFPPGNNIWDFMEKHYWKNHFMLVTVNGRSLTCTAIDNKGNVLDEFTIGVKNRKPLIDKIKRYIQRGNTFIEKKKYARAYKAFKQGAAVGIDAPERKESLEKAEIIIREVNEKIKKAQESIHSKQYGKGYVLLETVEKEYRGLDQAATAKELLRKLKLDKTIKQYLQEQLKKAKLEQSFERAEELERAGKKKGALTLYKKIVTAGSKYNYEVSKKSAAKVKLLTGKTYSANTAKNQKQAKVLWDLARMMIEQGQESQGKRYLEDIIKNYPDTEYAEKARKKLKEL